MEPLGRTRWRYQDARCRFPAAQGLGLRRASRRRGFGRRGIPRGLTFYYNKSDNFNPPAGAQTDYFSKPLPKPTGDGKDGGFGFNLFDNKLVARVNWYETENQRAHRRRRHPAHPLASIRIRPPAFRGPAPCSASATASPAARTLEQIVAVTNWNSDAVNPVGDTANQQKIYDLIQLPLNYYSGIELRRTQHSQAKGVELQLTYNPTSNWTMKFTGATSKTSTPTWPRNTTPGSPSACRSGSRTAAPEIPDFTDAHGRRYSLRNFWTGYGYTANAQIENTNGNTSAQAYFNNVVVSQVGARQGPRGRGRAPRSGIYHASFLTNYRFPRRPVQGLLRRWQRTLGIEGRDRFLGKVGDPVTTPTVINVADVTRPVYRRRQLLHRSVDRLLAAGSPGTRSA